MRRPWIPLALGLALGWSMTAQEAKPAPPAASEDSRLWLEEVSGEKAMEWVKARNVGSGKELTETPAFLKLKADLLKIYDSKERIPGVYKQGTHFYNFWQDAKNPRGLWRRTSLEEYRKADPKWEVVLDLDALGKAEKENWVWHGAQILKAGGYRHVLVNLSRGGADASVTREFDMITRTFVKDGFQIPEAKGSLSWIDKDTVYVATDFGPGSMTTSGYTRIVKRWKRGTPLAQAVTVYEGKDTDMSIGAFYDDTKGFERHYVSRTPAFYQNELFLLGKDGKLQKIEVPLDASAQPFREWMTVQLRTPWTVGGKTYPGGALLVTNFEAFMAGKREFTVLYEPTTTSSLDSFNWTRHHLILNVLEDVKNRLSVLTPAKGAWKRSEFKGAPRFSTVSAYAVDAEESDDYWMNISDFLTPPSLYLGRIGGKPEKLKEMPAFFDASGLEVAQHFAISKDGTKVPYFQVSPKGLKLDGSNPTLLNGYGGFEVSMTPSYSGSIGLAWLNQGGVYVLSNIRGGGEYGPRWHQAALKQNRHRAYEDFAAIAQDLVTRKVTSVKHLGAMGGSNGGLLMGNMITLYPQLFGAIVCQVPLLDMQRYSHLLAGASWMAEYGDPDKPEEWAFIKTFSPYHNLKAGTTYPPTLFATSTRDDRVHPGHARKMMAAMQEMGADVRYYENIEGGHGGAADNSQRAHMWAMAYRFLWQKLK
ncbi:MAG: prolyl oligopeptidase family serine peptidase [Holophaga sp.]|nr:prolyl oligopeptidase family serine peptidase [Holophaga sp.]